MTSFEDDDSAIPDISSVGLALVALEAEMVALREEADRHRGKLLLTMGKLRSCHAAVAKILQNAHRSNQSASLVASKDKSNQS